MEIRLHKDFLILLSNLKNKFKVFSLLDGKNYHIDSWVLGRKMKCLLSLIFLILQVKFIQRFWTMEKCNN